MVGRGACLEPIDRRADDALRQFLAAVIGDLRGFVGERGIGKTFREIADVTLRIEAGVGGKGRDGFSPQRVDKFADRLIGEGRCHGFVAAEQSEIGDGRVRAIEQPKLHLLERQDIAHHGHAELFP